MSCAMPRIPTDVEALLEIRERAGSAKHSAAHFKEAVPWVVANLDRENVQKSKAPSSIAYNMWRMAREDPMEFMKAFAKQLAPSSKDMESDARFYDDGRDVLPILDRLVRAECKRDGDRPDVGDREPG